MRKGIFRSISGTTKNPIRNTTCSSGFLSLSQGAQRKLILNRLSAEWNVFFEICNQLLRLFVSLTCKVQVTLNNISKDKAMAVQKALEPDNVNFPENLTLEIENVDNKLVFHFEGQKNMKSLIATVDEVLEHVQVALKVIE